MKTTDEMVRVMIHQTFFPLPGESLSQEVYEEHEPHFRRGLEAALNAAPVAGDAPTDAEFEAALDEWFKAESAANWYRRNGLVGHFTADERAEAEARWELVIAEAESTRQRILALHADARNAAPRAEPDAEFEAALTHYAVAVLDTQPRFVGFPTIEEADAEIKRTTKAYTPLRAARARVEALYADARNAGLRELRGSIEHQIVFWEGRTVADPPEHYGWVLEEIESMLKGGDGAG